MVISRTYQGKLNRDQSKYWLPASDYPDARNISRDARGGATDDAITAIAGNKMVESGLYRPGDKVVGTVADSANNRIIFMQYHPSGQHRIMQYNATANVVSQILVNLGQTNGVDLLALQADSFIQMNIINRPAGEGDLLFFLNGAKKPCCINVEKTADGTRIPLTDSKIGVIKAPPSVLPAVSYRDDANRRMNSLVNKLFKFRYRFVYEDGNKSVWSAISDVPLKPGATVPELQGDPSVNNCISVSMQTGPIDVRKIELAVSISVNDLWSDFLFVESFDKANRDISDDRFFIYNFYNDGAYPAIDINESNLLFDWVPDEAGAQELVNGNVPVYGDIVEGYDQTVVPDVRIMEKTRDGSSVPQAGTLTYSMVGVARSEGFLSSYRIITWYFTLTGSAIAGTQIKMAVLYKGEPIEEWGVTLMLNSSRETVVDLLWAQKKLHWPNPPSPIIPNYSSDRSQFQLILPQVHRNDVADWHTTMEIIPPNSIGSTNTKSSFLWGTKRRLGLVYFDKNGKTNGVVTRTNLFDSGLDSNLRDFEVSFPQYAENANNIPLIPYIRAEINHLPPAWAEYYHWVISKNMTIGSYLFWSCRNMIVDNDYVYFDVSNIKFNATRNNSQEDVLKYSFAKGDRLRLIKNLTSGQVFDDTHDIEITGFLNSPKINNVETVGEFIKVPKKGRFSNLTETDPNIFEMMLYSPYQFAGGENEVYYEFGHGFPIVTDIDTGIRYHGGREQTQTADQPSVVEMYNGDAYFRARAVYLNEAADGFSSFTVMDANYSDSFRSAVSAISGRPNIVDVNAKKGHFPAMIRFGQSYQQGTVINNTNRFLGENFDDYNISFGRIKRLRERDKVMRVFQEMKCGAVPVYQQVIKDAVGNDVLAQSDLLLNKIQYYAGNFGIGDCPESLASNNYSDYFIDNRRGVVCRLSLDGLTPVSQTFDMNSWATALLPNMGTGAKAYGVFDAEFNRYILAMEQAGSQPADAVTFTENSKAAKGFESFADFYPEAVVCMGAVLYAFKVGRMWIHRDAVPASFFGTQYKPSITGIFNDRADMKKNFTNIKVIGNKLWLPEQIQTSLGQQSSLIPEDFRKKEDGYNAGFMRDANSPGGIIRGDRLKGNYIEIKFVAQSPETDSSLVLTQAIFNESQLNKK